MNTLSIDEAISLDECVVKYYGGTLPSDLLPSEIKSFPICFIVNTAPRDDCGEHWVSLFLYKAGDLEIFCSFGSGPFVLSISPHIKLFLEKFGFNKIVYNANAIQNVSSSYCGLYAIIYLKIRCRNYSFNDFLSCFVKSTVLNDAMIESIKDMIL